MKVKCRSHGPLARKAGRPFRLSLTTETRRTVSRWLARRGGVPPAQLRWWDFLPPRLGEEGSRERCARRGKGESAWSDDHCELAKGAATSDETDDMTNDPRMIRNPPSLSWTTDSEAPAGEDLATWRYSTATTRRVVHPPQVLVVLPGRWMTLVISCAFLALWLRPHDPLDTVDKHLGIMRPHYCASSQVDGSGCSHRCPRFLTTGRLVPQAP